MKKAVFRAKYRDLEIFKENLESKEELKIEKTEEKKTEKKETKKAGKKKND